MQDKDMTRDQFVDELLMNLAPGHLFAEGFTYRGLYEHLAGVNRLVNEQIKRGDRYRDERNAARRRLARMRALAGYAPEDGSPDPFAPEVSAIATQG